MTYTELKAKHQDEVNKFEGLIFAFSEVQLKENMLKIGLNIEIDCKKIVSIGAGGYLLKEKIKEFNAMFARHKAEKQALKKDEKKLKEAITAELVNHEFCYTGEETEALAQLEIKKEDIPLKVLNECKLEAVRLCNV